LIGELDEPCVVPSILGNGFNGIGVRARQQSSHRTYLPDSHHPAPGTPTLATVANDYRTALPVIRSQPGLRHSSTLDSWIRLYKQLTKVPYALRISGQVRRQGRARLPAAVMTVNANIDSCLVDVGAMNGRRMF
jgi:hypothetical protein